MEEAFRNAVNDCMVLMTSKLDLNGNLLSILQSFLSQSSRSHVLLDHHVEQILSKPTSIEKRRELITILKTRGSDALPLFYRALIISGQAHLASEFAIAVIRNVTGQNYTGEYFEMHLPIEFEQMSIPYPAKQPLKEAGEFYAGDKMGFPAVPLPNGVMQLSITSCADGIISDFNENDIYRNFTKPKGLALIINQRNFSSRSQLQERIGTDVDALNMRRLFEGLGYQVKLKDNLTKKELLDAMDRFSKKPEHSKCDSAIITILSHGERGQIYGVDGELIDVDKLIGYMGSNSCVALKGKPKLFFIQACRGKRFDTCDGANGAMSTDEQVTKQLEDMNEADGNAIRKVLDDRIPNEADILIAYATVPGYVSWRNSVRGSWFIQSICEVFKDDANRESILDLLTKVNRKVMQAFQSADGSKQIPEPCSRLTKKFYFYPGIHR